MCFHHHFVLNVGWLSFGKDDRGMKIEDQQDVTIRCFLLTSVSTCFGHHYAYLQENKDPVTAFGVLFWFCCYQRLWGAVLQDVITIVIFVLL